MLNIKDWLVWDKQLELFLRLLLWKQMGNDLFLLVLKVFLVVHQLEKTCWHMSVAASCDGLTILSLLDSWGLGVVCFAHMRDPKCCLQAPPMQLSELMKRGGLDLACFKIVVLSLAQRVQFFVVDVLSALMAFSIRITLPSKCSWWRFLSRAQVLLMCFQQPSCAIWWNFCTKDDILDANGPSKQALMVAFPFKSPRSAHVLSVAQLHHLVEFLHQDGILDLNQPSKASVIVVSSDNVLQTPELVLGI